MMPSSAESSFSKAVCCSGSRRRSQRGEPEVEDVELELELLEEEEELNIELIPPMAPIIVAALLFDGPDLDNAVKSD